MKTVLNYWWMRLERIKILRILVSPYKKWKTNYLYSGYLKSDDCQKIKKLKNIHKGERCFIIGNGPSMKSEDLERLKYEFTFASNRIYEMFDKTTWRPTVYLAVDPNFLDTEYKNICDVPCEFKLIAYRWCKRRKKLHVDKNAIQIWRGVKEFEVVRPVPWADKTAYIPEDISLGFSEGMTVTFDAIQMAIHMGFQEIYLLGVDFSYSRVVDGNGVIRNMDGVTDYFNHKTYNTTIMYYEPTKYAYTVARKYCDTHGIVIKNATRGGKLEIFERVNFDSLF